jgi:hypothetical protein
MRFFDFRVLTLVSYMAVTHILGSTSVPAGPGNGNAHGSHLKHGHQTTTATATVRKS